MSDRTAAGRNLWELTVLCMLRARPMHPYEMARLIREWHKADFLELKQGSLYHSIQRLERADLIEAMETQREGRRPERTVYGLTEKGVAEAENRLRGLLAEPIHEPSQLMAALSFLGHLAPEDVARQLQVRSERLQAELAELERVLRDLTPRLGRLLLLEVEYTRALRQAELSWLRELQADLEAGRLTWDPEQVRETHSGTGTRETPALEPAE